MTFSAEQSIKMLHFNVILKNGKWRTDSLHSIFHFNNVDNFFNILQLEFSKVHNDDHVKYEILSGLPSNYFVMKYRYDFYRIIY